MLTFINFTFFRFLIYSFAAPQPKKPKIKKASKQALSADMVETDDEDGIVPIESDDDRANRQGLHFTFPLHLI